MVSGARHFLAANEKFFRPPTVYRRAGEREAPTAERSGGRNEQAQAEKATVRRQVVPLRGAEAPSVPPRPEREPVERPAETGGGGGPERVREPLGGRAPRSSPSRTHDAAVSGADPVDAHRSLRFAAMDAGIGRKAATRKPNARAAATTRLPASRREDNQRRRQALPRPSTHFSGYSGQRFMYCCPSKARCRCPSDTVVWVDTEVGRVPLLGHAQLRDHKAWRVHVRG